MIICACAGGQGKASPPKTRDKKPRGQDMSKQFNYLDNQASVICESSSTRQGFKHTCKLFYKGRLIFQDKINYYNRTWESFEYESVLRLAENYIDNNIINDSKFSRITRA